MIIDGYNVIYAWGLDTSSLEDARAALLDILDDYAGFTGESILVVFDGYRTRSAASEMRHGLIDVVFTAHGVTADTHIQRIAKTSSEPLTVVTGDFLEQLSVFGSGSMRLTPSELKILIRQAREKHIDHIHRSTLTGSELKKKLYLDAISDH